MRALGAVLALACWNAAAAPGVKVGVFGLFRPQRLTVKPAPGHVVRLEAGGEAMELEAGLTAGLRREGASVDCFARRRLVTAPAVRVAARDGGPGEFVLGVPGRVERRFRGVLHVRAEAAALLAVIEVGLETAVASAVAAELPAGTPLEALAAQAIVARSYYTVGRGRHGSYDFCDTTHCQFLREPPQDGSAYEKAVRLTRGMVLVYGDQVVAGLYSAACGGRTRAAAETGMTAGRYPYFSVPCGHCLRHAREWESRLSPADGAALLARPGSEALRLEIVRRLGWGTLPGNNYLVVREDGRIVFRGRGAGHGVGLCQEGAAAMARGGASCRDILAHYYPAATVEVR